MNKTLNSIEKRMSSGGKDTPKLDMSQFIKMAEKDPDDGFKLELLPQIKELFNEFGKPGETLDEFILRIDEETLKRIQLNDGGKVIDFLKYAKSREPRVKKLNLAQNDFERAVIDVKSEADKQMIKKLLRMSGINVGSDD